MRDFSLPKIKLCGLSRPCDIETANRLKPEYIGFVFASRSKRAVSPENAAQLKKLLDPGITAVGVFVNEDPEVIVSLLQRRIIDAVQLHGQEDESMIHQLKCLTSQPVIKAFRIDTPQDLASAQSSSADAILLDSGSGGTGTPFDWTLIRQLTRPYFLAGGLHPGNVYDAINTLHPYGVDVSSGIETNGLKDPKKMLQFVTAVRGKDKRK